MMSVVQVTENLNGVLSEDLIRGNIERTLGDHKGAKRVLVIHPDYTRTDFSHILFLEGFNTPELCSG